MDVNQQPASMLLLLAPHTPPTCDHLQPGHLGAKLHGEGDVGGHHQLGQWVAACVCVCVCVCVLEITRERTVCVCVCVCDARRQHRAAKQLQEMRVASVHLLLDFVGRAKNQALD